MMFTAAVKFGSCGLLEGAGIQQTVGWSDRATWSLVCFGSVADTLNSLFWTAPRTSAGPTEPSSQCLPGAL
jgi:hypothetical protein